MRSAHHVACLAVLLGAAAALAAPPVEGWTVRDAGRSANGLHWHAVVHSGVTYGEYSTRGHAEAVAGELTRRKLGPYWHRGLKAQDVIDTERAVSDAALAKLKPVPLDEQKRWWAEHSKRNEGGR